MPRESLLKYIYSYTSVSFQVAAEYNQVYKYIYVYFLLKERAASALMIFFDRDLILLMVGGSWKIT
jgi:hypothetical protein